MFFVAGVRSATMKVHLLQHLPEVVEKWGALWAYSCFWFESLNGLLKRFVHRTRYVSSQISYMYIVVGRS
jgi:hypothetical protein